MKILVAINQSRVLYDFKKELVDALAGQGDKLVLSFVEDFRAEYFRRPELEILPTPLDPRGARPDRDLRLYLFYRRILRRERPDLVLTFTIKPNVYCGLAAARARTPYLATISGLGSAVHSGGLLGILTSRMYRVGLRGATRVFCQNGAIEEWALRNCAAKESQIVRVPGSGVNLDRFHSLPYPSETGRINLLFIGRLMPDKGVVELIEAARRVRATRPNVRFQLLGAPEVGSDVARLVESAAFDGVIERLGYQLDVVPYLREASALLLPSWHEGMSNALLEAAASARPVIASDVPGCREIFVDGVTGFGHAPRDAASLAAALERFLALPREKREEMGRLGRQKIEAEFSRALVVDAYLREIRKFRDLLKTKRSEP